MRNPLKRPYDPLDDQITKVLDEMTMEGVDSVEYPKLMTYLERLYELKSKKDREPVSWDTMATVAGNLMGIFLIVAYEQKHVITSKAIGQVIRPRT